MGHNVSGRKRQGYIMSSRLVDFPTGFWPSAARAVGKSSRLASRTSPALTHPERSPPS